MLKDNAMFISKHFMEGNIKTHPNIFREDKYVYKLVGKKLKQWTVDLKYYCRNSFIEKYGNKLCKQLKEFIEEGYNEFNYGMNSNKFFYGKPAYVHQKWTWTRKERKEFIEKKKYKRKSINKRKLEEELLCM